MIMPLVGGLYHVQRTSTLWAHAPRRRTLSRTTDFALVIGSDHLKILCTHHWEWLPLRSCPSSEDFVTYNGLRLSGPTPLVGGLWHVQRTLTLWANAPRRRTLSRTTDFTLIIESDHLKIFFVVGFLNRFGNVLGRRKFFFNRFWSVVTLNIPLLKCVAARYLLLLPLN